MSPGSSFTCNSILCARNLKGRVDWYRNSFYILPNSLNEVNVIGLICVRDIEVGSSHSSPYIVVYIRTSLDQSSVIDKSPLSFIRTTPRQYRPAQAIYQPHHISITYNYVCASIYPSVQPILFHGTQSVQLFIKSIRNTTISIRIALTSSVADLKRLIDTHDGIPPCYQRLMHRGRELRDDALLSGLDVDGATITCLLRVLGGNPRTHKLPIHWWFGFSRSYEDGRVGEEGRICHVLSEIKFVVIPPPNWYSAEPLSEWYGISLDSDMQISSLPESVGTLSTLVNFHINYAKLSHLPESIGNLTCLVHLNVRCNHLGSLPDCIGSLSSLTHLMASNNRLKSLPQSIGNMTSLVLLSVGYNQLSCLPDSIGNLMSLTHLEANDNKLRLIPDWIANLARLIHLDVAYNPITSSQARRDDVQLRFNRDGLDIIDS